MERIFENIEGNKFKLISESITEDEPKSSLIRKGLKKVFSEGENEYSYRRLESLGMGYIRNVEEAKKCALQEARELALEYGYKDDENNSKFVKEGITDPVAHSISTAMFNASKEDVSNPAEKREIQIGERLVELAARNGAGGALGHSTPTSHFADEVLKLGHELIDMHSPNGPVVKPGTGPRALYKRGSIY